MTSIEEKLNFLDIDVKFWQGFSSYKKADYLIQNPPDCSFVITLDSYNSKNFPAHKAILESASPVFEDIFKSNNNSKDIPLSDTEPKVFKKFLDFIYYGGDDNLRCADANTLRNLIALGKQFKVEDLIKTCVDTMKQNLPNAENYDLINIFEYACLMEDSELIKECKRVIVSRAKANHKFTDFNFNQQEEKRHIVWQLSGGPQGIATKTTSSFAENNVAAQNNSTRNEATNANKPITGGGLNILGGSTNTGALFGNTATTPTVLGNFASSSQPFTFFTTPSSQLTEEKLQNTESSQSNNAGNTGSACNAGNIFSLNTFPSIGLNKGKITDCACIYNLNPSVFYELQITLSGYISELLRFNMIETYAKINGLTGDDVDNKMVELKKQNNANSDKENGLKQEKDDSMPELKKQSNMALSKQILNMLLRSIKFYRMSAKEFCSGPGKSSLLDMEEKYDLLVTIVNKN